MIEIEDNNSAYMDLKQHVGHTLVCEALGDDVRNPESILLECETCGEVIIEADSPKAEI